MKELFKKIVVAVLTFEARLLLQRTKPKIVAITGSVGKTSTKDAIYTVLKSHVHARKSEKSFNSDIGVALTVLGLQNAWNNPFLWLKNIIDGALQVLFASDYPKVLVLEMGVDRKGDMKRLTEWIKPDVVVITSLPDVPVHVEYFASPEEIIEEKMNLVYALKPDGVFIYNNDDQKVHAYLDEVRQQSLAFSRYSPSHFSVTGDAVLYDGSLPVGIQFTMHHIDIEAQAVVHGSLGVQHAYSYAAAAAVGHVFDISLAEAAAKLQSHVPPQGRMRIIAGVNGSVILDDTYNSSPTACEHALQTLAELRVQGRKIAVLGDMLELGQFSVQEHERMGTLAGTRVDMLATLGVRSRKIAEGALENGLSEKCVFQYEDAEKAALELKQMIKKDDVILVKASQGMRAEKIVAFLMEATDKADELLVRQDAMWEKR